MFTRYMRYENLLGLRAICAVRMFTRYMRYENLLCLGALGARLGGRFAAPKKGKTVLILVVASLRAICAIRAARIFCV